MRSIARRTIPKRDKINAQTQKSTHVPPLISGVVAILFSSVAMTIVPIMGWVHASSEGSDEIVAQEHTPEMPAAPRSVALSGAGEARVKARCDRCGVIRSMRRLAPVGDSPEIYEITVHLRDGSTHVLSDVSPANWRPGDRMILIGGTDQLGG